MKLGDVLKKERKKAGLSAVEMAAKLDVDTETYTSMEAGESAAEVWGRRLSDLAIALETPTSRLLAESGRAADTRPGQAGPLITAQRNRRGLSVGEMAAKIDVTADEYRQIEAGESPLEEIGPRLLRFAEVIEQPVFNLFYPCGLPFWELDDYP